ncbi:MAG: hypothetical protein KatS3mg013_1736 [Actinomycetota bacterium]|nr:MAG: hypothetical protein KatS3mg013_1736 [Actinomycetota bacterium]
METATRARASAVIVAAGSGSRLGGREPKAFRRLGARSILARAAAGAASAPGVVRIVVAVPAGLEARAREELRDLPVPTEVVAGGPTRQDSVRLGLEALPEDPPVVVVHDAARCFAAPQLFVRVIDAVAAGAVGAVPVVEVVDTVKRLGDGRVLATLERAELALAQTPQAFDLAALRAAHVRAVAQGRRASDDAALLEADHEVLAVPGDPGNVKVTTPWDLVLAERRAREEGGG